MNTLALDSSLNTLLTRLREGDGVAAEKLFVAYEPYLRMVVRRQLSAALRAKFDSVDVVQSVWADVLQGFRGSAWSFENAAQLRAFLVRATRNRFIDRCRQQRRALACEQPIAGTAGEGLPPGREPRPSEIAQAEELWQQLLRLCPPAHRELLRLKRQGCSLAEIAAQTGLHESSVRRILYELARKLARQQHQESGVRSQESGVRSKKPLSSAPDS